MQRLTADFWLGLLLFLGGISAALLLVPTVVEPAPGGGRGWAQSPRFLPLMCFYLITILGLSIAIRALTRPNKADPKVTGEDMRAVLLVLAAISAIVWLTPLAGALLASVGASVGLILITGERRLLPTMTAGVLVPVAAVLLLTQIAAVPLRIGIPLF